MHLSNLNWQEYINLRGLLRSCCACGCGWICIKMHKNAIFFEYSYALMMIFVSTSLAFSLPKLIIKRLVYIHALSSLRRASPMPFSKNSIAHSCKSFAYRGGGGTYSREGFVSESGSDPKWIFNKKVCKMQTISYIKRCIFWKRRFDLLLNLIKMN